MMNILTREKEPKIRPFYTSICLCNPFFNAKNGWILNKFAPILDFVEKNLIPGAYLPEVIQKESEFPQHILPVHYDFSNPLQRRFIPLRTVVELLNISRGFEKLVFGGRREFARVRKPVMVVTGAVDKIVCNETTDVVSALLMEARAAGPDKQAPRPTVTHLNFPHLDHGTFFDGIIFPKILELSTKWMDSVGKSG